MDANGQKRVWMAWMTAIAAGLMALSGCHQVHKARARQLVHSCQEHYAKGDFDKALEISEIAIRLGAEPAVLPVLFTMRGSIFLRKRLPEEALKEFDLGLAAADAAGTEGRLAMPGLTAEMLATRGNVLQILGRYRESLDSFQKAVEIDDAKADAHNNIAWVLATIPLDSMRDGQKAIVHATKACELTGWKNAAFLDTLAAAHAEAGDFENAVRWQTEAREFLHEKDAVNIRGFEARLSLYRESEPYREDPRTLYAEMLAEEQEAAQTPQDRSPGETRPEQ